MEKLWRVVGYWADAQHEIHGRVLGEFESYADARREFPNLFATLDGVVGTNGIIKQLAIEGDYKQAYRRGE